MSDIVNEELEAQLQVAEPKKSRAELELERLQRVVAKLQTQVDAEAKLLEECGPEAEELAYALHDTFCELCANSKSAACAVATARISGSPDWSDEYYQYWLKAAAKVADFLTSKGWQKPQED